VNEKRAAVKREKQEASFFNGLINKRMLESLSEGDANPGTQETKNSTAVCSRGSEDLISYYETGDKTKINLDGKGIECKNKDDDYMQALIALVKKYVDDNETDTNEGEGEDEEFDKENAVKYIKHIFPLLIFFTFGILSTIGWLICCFCNCCNCCCCCCCKKP
jgi:hypothetical protein